MADSPQWLHLLLRAKRTLNSLLHFLQAGSERTESGGGPLRSGRPLVVFMMESGKGQWDDCTAAVAHVHLTKLLIGGPLGGKSCNRRGSERSRRLSCTNHWQNESCRRPQQDERPSDRTRQSFFFPFLLRICRVGFGKIRPSNLIIANPAYFPCRENKCSRQTVMGS
jgi:hypothetical protein